MKKIILIFMFVCFATVSFQVDVFAFFKSTKFTVVVVSEKDEPIEGIKVGVGFEKNTGWGTDSTGQQSITDSEGRLTFSGQSNGHITFGGSREGYYSSYYDFNFRDLGPFGWQPWNPELKIVMRKIENPVAMYARHAGQGKKLEIPAMNEDIGFDLMVSDWVAPYGKGVVPDFVLNFRRDNLNPEKYSSELKMSFSNKNDGIFIIDKDLGNGSFFKLMRFAPENGYLSKLSLFAKRNTVIGFQESFKDSDNYVFRVRSEVGEDGNVKEAMYGKIIGPVRIFPARSKKSTIIQFKYYINPDHTRNLEFDPRKNLFGKLPILERVKQP